MQRVRDDPDVLVIGAGFGGLASALHLAEAGADVLICEALKYPGGCASTFRKEGHRFEAGATLFSGLAPDQLFGRWREQHGLDVRFRLLDPAITFRTPALELRVHARREAFVEELCALPGAPVAGLRAFFASQARVADALWPVFDDPGRLPPFDPAGLAFHAARLPRYLPVARWVGRPLVDVLRHHGVAGFPPLRHFLDALCQITVQVEASRAEAPFALAAMDYCFRGVGHVEGGIGQLAWALLRAAEALGAEVRLPARVRGLRRVDGHWEAEVRGERVRAGQVVANLLPQALQALLAEPLPALEQPASRVAEGWGAAMLYLVLEDGPALPEAPHHLELVADPARAFREGNHVFVSLSGRGEDPEAPPGTRTATVSTHLSPHLLRGLVTAERARLVEEVQGAMAATIARLAPEVHGRIRRVFPASPRTWERFTRRPEGLVGGVPRRAGLEAYAGLGVSPAAPGLFLVGDSVFPGQSTLATALGGARTAAVVGRAAG